MTRDKESDHEGAHEIIEIKAASFTMPVIRLLGVEMNEITEHIRTKVEQAPDFFRNTPVVIDLGALDDPAAEVNFPRLVGLLRGYGMLPIGLRGGSPRQQEAAQAMELAVMSDSVRRRVRESARDEHQAQTENPQNGYGNGDGHTHGESTDPALGIEFGSVLITKPVRSGQKVYAAGGDLTVTAAVNSGAELMADGNIHIYGPLRGRVFAGIHGNTKARIFCQDLQAELVAVAGHYRVSENIPAKLKNARVQIFLERETLRIEPF